MLQEIIIEVLCDYVEIDPETLSLETDLIKELKLTSYDRISLMGDLERRLGMNVPEERIAHLVTLGDVNNLLYELKNDMAP